MIEILCYKDNLPGKICPWAKAAARYCWSWGEKTYPPPAALGMTPGAVAVPGAPAGAPGGAPVELEMPAAAAAAAEKNKDIFVKVF